MRDYIDALERLSHKQLVVMLARQRFAATQGIAVVGMAMRFPGGVDSPAAFWEALRDSRVGFAGEPRIPVDSTGRERWNLDAPDLKPYADLLSRGAYVADVDLFDAERYRIPDEEAMFLDPQQRLLVTCAAEALADADIDDMNGLRTGVFAALGAVEYHHAAIRNGLGFDELSAAMAPGSAVSGAAGRIATCLRLDGPALTVDTASSSALTALHLACASLRAGECDVAIVGASQLALAPAGFGVVARSGMLSPTGRARPFDAAADGYVRGEGCGVLVLRRQQDAANGYAAVKGTAVYQYGDRGAITAVSAIALSRVIRDALRAAQVAPHQVSFVEAQANGLRLPAIVEAEVLADVYGRTGSADPPLWVGSSKANLGYLETVSGMASLMKTVLAVQHAEIPPQAGFEVPDPAIPWDSWSLAVPGAATPFPAGPSRLAGVSAAGFTGTYCHSIVESVDDSVPRPPRPAGGRAGRGYWPESHRWS